MEIPYEGPRFSPPDYKSEAWNYKKDIAELEKYIKDTDQIEKFREWLEADDD